MGCHFLLQGLLLTQGWNPCLLCHLLWQAGSLTLAPPGKLYAAAAKSLQLCPTLCDPIDGSPPGSPIPGILQARILEWAAISFSNAWKWKVKVKSLSPVQLLATPRTAVHQAPLPMGFSRQEQRSGLPLPSPGSYRYICVYIYIHKHCCCSVIKSCWILCNPMDCSMPGLPVHHQLPEFAQIHVHRVSDVIQPSHPLLPPSRPGFNFSQHQCLFQCAGSLHTSIWSFLNRYLKYLHSDLLTFSYNTYPVFLLLFLLLNWMNYQIFKI